MKIVKKIVYIIILTIASLIMYSTITRAATIVTVATETLNLRKKASTSSDIVATLSEGVKCELLEESGDWYKVKYKTYTGYVSKEYVKKNEEKTNDDIKQEDNQENNNLNDNDGNTGNKQTPDTSVENSNTQSTGKVSSKTDVKVVPLIYSSKIDELAKNETVTILTEMNGWAYIQTDSITGWIRSNVITGKKTTDTANIGTNNTQGNNTNGITNTIDSTETNTTTSDNQTSTTTEKTVYIKESSVNLRKEPNTSSKILMVVGLNQKLTVIGENGDWYQVKTSEGNAYVLKTLVSDKKVTTSRGNTLIGHTNTAAVNEVSQTATEAKVTTSTTNTSKTTNVTASIKTLSSSNSTSSSSTKGQEVVKYAKQFLGVPYVYGGASKSGFDCSGFTMYVYKKFGISMRHGAQAQAKIGKVVNADKKSASSLKQNLQPGDLVFFLDYETMDEIGHCGIYIGNGNFIHASSGSGYCVKINSLLPGEYYNTRYCAARRVL